MKALRAWKSSLKVFESAEELLSLKCVTVFFRTNRTAIPWSSRLEKSSRETKRRSFPVPVLLLLPLHLNPAQSLKDNP